MKKQNLVQIGRGFYLDEERFFYIDIKEFLAAYGLPDRPEVRQAIWDEIEQAFGNIPVYELTEE